MSTNRWYNNKKKVKKEDNYIPPYDAALLAEPVEKLAVSPEVIQKLKSGKVNTLLDVAKRTERDFYKIPTFNKKNLFELRNAVLSKRLSFRPDETENPQAVNPGKNNPQKINAQKGKPPLKPENGRAEDNRAKNAAPQKTGAPNHKSDRGDQKKQHIKAFDDGISEQKTKEEREKRRPPKPVVQNTQDIYIKINKNNKWGFADRSGKEVIAPIYDEVFTFKDDLCCVEKDELFGYIDRKGEEVIPIMYDCATSFSEGYACVYKGNFCGYINKNNEVVIDFKFDAGTAVTDGNCRVKRDGKWGELYIDKPLEIRWIN